MSRRSHLYVGILAALLLAPGCGHRGAPKPPPRKVPAPIPDLSVQQRGEALILGFSYPQITVSGLPIEDIVAIEVWEYALPVPDLQLDGDEEEEEDGEDEAEGEDGAEAEEVDESDGAETLEAAEEEVEGPVVDFGEGREGFDDLPDIGDDFLDPTIEREEGPGVRYVPEEENGGEGDEDGGEAAEGEPAAEPEGEADDDLPAGDEAEDEGEADDGERGDDEEVGEGDEVAEDDEGDDEENGEGDGDEEGEDEDVERPGVTQSREALLELDSREFAAGAKLVLTLEGDDLLGGIRGERVRARIPLDEIEPGEQEARAYGVKSFQRLARASALSNLALIIPRLPPPAPTELEAVPGNAGVRLSWSFEGEEEPAEFRIYRRPAGTGSFGDSIGKLEPDLDEFLDAGAVYGTSYVYAVTAVQQVKPLVESAFSEEVAVDYADTFAPAPPANLVALAEVGAVRLLWDASRAPDVAGYIVLRRDGDGDFRPLFDEPRAQPDYTDRGVTSGRQYAYQVIAVDEAGNRGGPGKTAEVRVP